ncbi:hypothetical protein VST7929_01510 [Vibrio stylophorae]|uniref:Uncharacterized protein n=1 Tax=Vibrio stylophorae TaxID=659351 RepID=A0ABM8ZTZ6_9VIBR|nr:hypothetical protein [Vibrio stylophorae]CAH0533639.1 hypothetical protein VST7929_01510 [Vibrio stylophorae]
MGMYTILRKGTEYSTVDLLSEKAGEVINLLKYQEFIVVENSIEAESKETALVAYQALLLKQDAVRFDKVKTGFLPAALIICGTLFFSFSMLLTLILFIQQLLSMGSNPWYSWVYFFTYVPLILCMSSLFLAVGYMLKELRYLRFELKSQQFKP